MSWLPLSAQTVYFYYLTSRGVSQPACLSCYLMLDMLNHGILVESFHLICQSALMYLYKYTVYIHVCIHTVNVIRVQRGILAEARPTVRAKVAPCWTAFGSRFCGRGVCVCVRDTLSCAGFLTTLFCCLLTSRASVFYFSSENKSCRSVHVCTFYSIKST